MRTFFDAICEQLGNPFLLLLLLPVVLLQPTLCRGKHIRLFVFIQRCEVLANPGDTRGMPLFLGMV
jgi:hypothetical protein